MVKIPQDTNGIQAPNGGLRTMTNHKNKSPTFLQSLDKELIVIALGIFVFFGTMIILSAREEIFRNRVYESLTEEYGFTVLDGIIKSPSVIIVISSYDEFIDVARDQGVDTLYKYNNEYYIFNPGMVIAWKYYPRWWDFEP